MRGSIERAKIFTPFDALKGLGDALREKETPPIPKKEPCEDRRDELDCILRKMQKGDQVHVVYYKHGSYVKSSGILAKLDFTSRILQIDNVEIPFDAIWDCCG